MHFQLLKRGQPPYKEQNGWYQNVPYSEVPLYDLINNKRADLIECILYLADT